MKIITWNVGHQTKTGNGNLLHMAEALATISPDIIVLTEYVPGDLDGKFSTDLKETGFERKISEGQELPDRKNQVLIASRMRINKEILTPPPEIYQHAPWNILHVTIPELDLGVLGLRMPVRMSAHQKKTWWEWVIGIAETNRAHPFMFLGDFNTDESSGGPNGWQRVESLKKTGWGFARPSEGTSYWSYGRNGVITPFRIDYAFFSQKITVLKSRYRTESGTWHFTKNPELASTMNHGVKPMSDHAMLEIEFKLN